MTTAETNDETRLAILKHFFFGTSQLPPAGSVLAYGSGVDTLHASTLQALMETALHIEDFDSVDHSAESFDFWSYAASFDLTDNGIGKTLLISVV